MELSWRPSHGDFFAEEASRSLPFTFGGYFSKFASTNPSKEEWVNEFGDEFSLHQSEMPRRTLANTHRPPPYDSGDDGDDENDDDDDDENDDGFIDEIEGYFNFNDYVFNTVADRIDPSVSDHVSPCLSATRQPSSSLNPVHDGQTSLQDATFSAYFQILDARIQSGKRGESCFHEQSHSVFRTEDENIESNTENKRSKDSNEGNELGDCVMVEGEESEDEEDEMTDSCLNVIDHLDYVMFPTAEVLEFVRGGEMEVLEDVDDKDAACRRFLGEEQYDEDNKELGREELENRGRRWFRCGVFSKDVTRRLHRLRYGC
ncbi:hypothetical protein J3E69DRAFT_359903 [Trichoderma sp. SZMC 28015]